MSIPPVDGFDQYRSERKRRRLESGPKRPMGRNATVLQELEAHEATNARNERMTREVQEFFEEATRTAAMMVSKLSTSAEHELDVSVAREMSEFLNMTLQRARSFVEAMNRSGTDVDGIAELSTNIRNVVGPTLDAYRWEGSQSVAEGQIGRDPFAVDEGSGHDDAVEHEAVEETEEEDVDDDIVEISIEEGFSPMDDHEDGEPAPIEEHLAAQFAEPSPQGSRGPEGSGQSQGSPALQQWFESMLDEDAALRRSLKALVQIGAMEKDEARAIYQDARTLRSS